MMAIDQPITPGEPIRGKLNNLAVVPASLLPFKAKWQAVANNLPQGTVLVVLPRTNSTARQSAEVVVRYLKAEGRTVAVMGTERLFLGTLSQIEAG
jgi:hypothetical protein